ncbi:hypothetical protein B0H19DRAFT_1087008 [Mycena capillaripes]|nr:hypothetical protein B0H19DRAFT_1087008 [Mycena capillaripes]
MQCPFNLLIYHTRSVTSQDYLLSSRSPEFPRPYFATPISYSVPQLYNSSPWTPSCIHSPSVLVSTPLWYRRVATL